jgi:hypothetical protein
MHARLRGRFTSPSLGAFSNGKNERLHNLGSTSATVASTAKTFPEPEKTSLLSLLQNKSPLIGGAGLFIYEIITILSILMVD